MGRQARAILATRFSRKGIMNKLLCAIALATLAGCASMASAPTGQIAALPVVKVGDARPAGTEYVLHIPANSPIPVKLQARGSLLKAEQSVAGTISFARDVYLYKYWASHDRQHWENSHRLLNVSFNGGFDIAGLNVNVSLDQK